MEKQLSIRHVLLIMMALIAVSVTSLYAAYNGECWVVSNGDTIYKLNANGLADPTVIPGLTQAQAAEVNPKTGVVWILVSAANTVYRFDPETQEFKNIPDIKRPHSVSINPSDGTVWIGGLDIVKKISADGSQILATITGVYEPEVAVNTTDGSCWVTDSRGKISKYDASGNLIITSPVKLTEPKYVAVNPKTGNAWVSDPQANILVKLNPNGQEILRITDIELPTSPQVNPNDGSLWVVANSSGLVKLSADGSKVLEVPDAGMAILSISADPKDGSVWVADQFGSTFQGEVSKFSAAGKKLFGNPIPLPSHVSVGYWSGQ